MQRVAIQTGFSINLDVLLLVSMTDSVQSANDRVPRPAHFSWLKDKQSSWSEPLDSPSLAADVPARLQMPQALLGLAGNCSRREVSGCRSQQMPRVCPSRQQHQQMAGQQLGLPPTGLHRGNVHR